MVSIHSRFGKHKEKTLQLFEIMQKNSICELLLHEAIVRGQLWTR